MLSGDCLINLLDFAYFFGFAQKAEKQGFSNCRWVWLKSS
ncbi:unnamed protein product, partial [marine sediment metagenome]